jgi:hypothetical protein
VIIALIALPAIAMMMMMLARVETSLTTAPRSRPEPMRPAAEPVLAEAEQAQAA